MHGVAFGYNISLLTHKKEYWSYNQSGPQTYYADHKTPNATDHVLYNYSICINKQGG